MKHDNLITSAHRTINSISTTHKAAMDNAARGKYFFRLLPTGFALRVMLLLVLLLVSRGYVLAQTIDADAVTVRNYTKYELPKDINMSSLISANWPSSKGSLTDDNFFIRWQIRKTDNSLATIGLWDNNSDVHFTSGSTSGQSNAWYLNQNSGNTSVLFSRYSDQNWFNVGMGGSIGIQEINTSISSGSASGLDGWILECYVSNLSNASSNTEVSSYQLKIEVVFNADGEEPITDPFLNVAKDGMTPTSGTKEIEKTITESTVDLTNSITVSPKYARVYLTNASGTKLESWDTSLLEVKYDGGGATQAGSSAKNGVYVANSDGIDKSKLSITLKAGANNFKNYKVVTLFSTDEFAGTQEPQWDEEYTFSFTYPSSVTEISETMDESVLEGQSIKITKVNDILTFFEKTNSQFASSWFARWYVTDDGGVKQSINSSTGTGTTWTVTNYQNNSDVWPTDRWHVADNTVWSDNTGTNESDGWFIEQCFANNTRIAAPNGTTLGDYGGYKIVLEVTDENSSSPEIKLRYLFIIPGADEFLGKAKSTATSGDGSQEVERTATSGSFTLDGVYTNDIKYARIVLCDATGKALDDQSKLVVTYDGSPAVAAGSKTKNGVYVYNAGGVLDKSKINITLNAGEGNMTKYRIRCLMAEDEAADISTKEPDWDYEYTYRFTYPARSTGYAALNINTVKTKYKTVLYDESSRSTTPRLLSNWYEVAGDCDASRQGLADNGYVRWYLTDAEGNLLTIKSLTSGEAYTSLDNEYGYYRQGFNVDNFKDGGGVTGSGDYTGYNPTITLPDGVDHNNVRVVCVATTLLDEMELPTQEPEMMQVKYVYVLKTQSELESAPFVHYVGESHRPYKTVTGSPSATEYSYNYETGLVDQTTYAAQNIRQDVYQQDYYVYLDPNNTNAENLLLKLPMEHWDKAPSDKRNSTEPLGYFRWYDYETDMKSAYLETIGGTANKLDETNPRGLIALMLSGSSTELYRNEIGVKFTGLSALNANKEILIACDVSRYMDGMDDSKTYLVHEPTLTIRYLYHILPASVIANAIDEKATLLKQVNDGTKNYATMTTSERVNMFKLYEDEGRVVVSLNGTAGKFALRADLQDLSQYFINNNSTPVQCSQIQWYCYYEDADGLWKKKVTMGDRSSLRLAKYEESEFNGEYTKVGSSETKNITIGNNTTVHLVGYIGNGSVEQAVVHYGLEFLNEAPAALGSEPTHRQDEYMYDNLKLGNVLDFNNFFIDEATRFDKPTQSYENYADVPMAFNNAQYGFCYPQLYGQCASNWMIHHGGWWDGYGFAPTHGDYTILKSMNMPGVSASQTYDQSIYTFWYNDGRGPLYDVTHERLDPGKTGNDAKYGSFLYVDASDEARTISHLQFDAPLCAGSEIYYTAYIANMTGIAPQDGKPNTPSQTPPQVMFRVSMDVTEGGVTKRVPVVSFLTGDLYTVGATEGTTWYQVYGYTRIPKEFEGYIDGAEHTYYVSIDNYAENTDGADYAIDQISFFTSSASVKVNQSSTPCDEGSGVEIQIVAPYEELVSVVGEGNTRTFFYRIFEKKSDDPNYVMKVEDAVPGPYKNSIATDVNLYGSAEFTATCPSTLHVGKGPADGTTGIYKDSDDGKVYFQFDRREFDLKTGKTYFVSFYSLERTQVTGFDDWGGPYGNKLCSSMFSNDITPKLLKIDMESGGESSDGTIGLGCGTTSVDKSFLITVQYPTLEGYSPHTDVMFDFYMGEKATFKSIKIGEDENVLYLEKALDHMRQKKNTPISSSSELPTDYDETYTQAMHDLLATYVDNGLLQLKATRTFSYTFTTANIGEQKFAAIPVSRHTTDGDICSPLEFVFNVVASSNAPKMELGFDDVDYPEEYTKRVVRVGLEQLNNMRKATDSYKLHIPVSNYQNKGGSGIGHKLHFSNPYLILSATNDPTAVINKKIAKLFDPDGGSSATDVYVNTNRMYLPLDFSGDNCEVAFHEGYYYEAVLSFYDEEDQSLDESDRCIGDLYLVFKVVPEFVTWNAREVGTDLYSGNWDDDGNWNRSERVELYKDDVNTHAQNSVTAGHPERYQNNAEIDERLTGRPAFVPMKFTYVTMLGNNHSPSLFSEDYLGKVAGTVQTGGDMINPGNGMGSDTSPSGGSSNATDYIKYDMLVRYGSHANGGEGCFGHRYKQSNGSGGYGWANDPREASAIEALTKVYDVEKFYGNICKEIYFKPGAELRLQQRLTYEKAWVEKELVANKWYLMSAPLKGTYAGDMYVPATAMTDYSLDTPAEVKGRQVTEAFQPINFDKSKGYSRTLYPIYQRSWGKTAKVYTKTDDIRATDYSAKLTFGSVSSNLVEWGHTYNDVQVPYTGYSGFAIRANKKDQTDNTLIRLPKADTQYDYYQWNNETASTGGVTQTVTKGSTVYGRLVYDNQGGGLMSDDLEQWSIPLANLQVQGTDEDGYTYYLVGNPFMASIDMGKFFGYLDGGSYYSYNPKLNPVYYTYEAGTVTAVDARTTAAVIRPLQAFIVKCKANDAPEGIVFNRWAITDGNYTPPTLYVPEGGSGTRAMNPTLTLRAANGNGSSEATVRIDASASSGYNAKEDASTLFDSNLSDVPMVYTVAGSRAVSIDSRPDLDVVSFGVACASNDELVEVNVDCSKFTDNGLQFTDDNHLYIIDAVTGSIMEVGVGSSFAVQPNDYGRYFLTTNGDMTAIRETLASENIVVSVRNRQLTVRSASELKMVRVLDTNGIVAASLNDCGTETTVNLTLGGVYIIEAETEHGRKTRKVIVK